jgi:hypothetical protein
MGDVSAVVMKNLPIWAQIIRTPSLDVALMDVWEEKIQKMAEVTSQENVTSILGVPTWTLVLIDKILEITGKDNILECGPTLNFSFMEQWHFILIGICSEIKFFLLKVLII